MEEDAHGQIIGGWVEGYECAVGEYAADDYAVDPPLSGVYRMDEAYGYDFFAENGG